MGSGCQHAEQINGSKKISPSSVQKVFTDFNFSAQSAVLQPQQEYNR